MVSFLALLAAGCLDAPGESLNPAASPLPTPFSAEGVTWLPASEGAGRSETILPFPVNGTGVALTVALRLGAHYGSELPASIADVHVELRAPDGEVLAKGALGTGRGHEERLAATAERPGEHALVLLAYGGSDGEANGDYVAWRIEAA